MDSLKPRQLAICGISPPSHSDYVAAITSDLQRRRKLIARIENTAVHLQDKYYRLGNPKLSCMIWQDGKIMGTGDKIREVVVPPLVAFSIAALPMRGAVTQGRSSSYATVMPEDAALIRNMMDECTKLGF